MESQALYDLAPATRLMLMGVVVALGPLAWVWLRNRQASTARRLRALTVLTLFLTFDLVVFGAFTRLTDSGLGCPDWPGCYGNASPLGASAEISAAQQAMPTGPVTHGKAWVEMVHRYLATGVGVLILTLAVASTVLRRREGAQVLPFSLWWPWVTLLWVCVQGAFGALTVTMKLFPAIVTLHLLGGLALLALLCVQAVRYGQAAGASAVTPLAAGSRALLWAGLALLTLQIALGGWVSTNYAVLACTEFPSCQGSYWPPMDFAQGFQIWRPLGLLADGNHITFAALTAIHYTHRLMAFVVIVVLGGLAWRLAAVPGLRAQARWIGLLLAWQFASGLSNVVLDWPLVAALAHTGGAAALLTVLTWTLSASCRAKTAASVSQPASSNSSASPRQIA
jgi:heme a synthase